MRIKEIVLEGFKSYAQRTVISGFDFHFNAITGFNGSGKSNILDAICFVLGISTLSTVRVSNLQELIYKNGQAGVTRANVTILFDNTDKERSYEAYKKCDQISVRREISIGGQSKYTINGTKVTAEKVKSLFTMSGLNVNNANFMIMQGRITQVTNMKPAEILSLVEETAGTNAYEVIKKKTQATIDKKNFKLQEMEDTLNNEINPKLENLQKEKEEFLRWKSLCDELQELGQKISAAKYQELLNEIKNSEELARDFDNQNESLAKKEAVVKKKLAKATHEYEELMKKSQALVSEEEQRKLDELRVHKEKSEMELKRKTKEMGEKTSEINGVTKTLVSLNSDIVRNKQQLVELKGSKEKLDREVKEKKDELESLQTRKQALEQGIPLEDDLNESRIQTKERALDKVKQEIATTDLKIQQSKKKYEAKLAQISRNRENHDQGAGEINAIQERIQEIQEELEKRGGKDFDRDLRQLENEKQELEQEIRNAERHLTELNANRFSLDYSDPEPGFDRNKVKGRVIRLINIKHEKYARGLEAGAAGGLFSVVVDTDVTGQLLLRRRALGNVKILPNNKMQPTIISNDIKRRVSDIFGQRAQVALDLIEYDPQIHNSIAHVFGNFYVCETKEMAQRIAYSNDIRKIAVTLEGDLYDPNGSISGGQSLNSSSMLESLNRIHQFEYAHKNAKRKLEEIMVKINNIGQQQKSLQKLRNELDIKNNDLRNKEAMQKESSFARLQEEVEELKGNLQVFQQNIIDLNRNRADIEKEIVTLKRESQKGVDQAEVLRKTLAKTDKEFKQLNKSRDVIRDKICEVEEETESKEKDKVFEEDKLRNLNNEADREKRELDKLRELVAKIVKEFEHANLQYELLLEKIALNTTAQEEIKKTKENFEREIENIHKDLQSLENKKKNLQKTLEKAFRETRALEDQNPWLSDFDMDLSNFDRNIEEGRYLRLKDEIDKQSKRVNKKVSSTLDDQEKRFKQLTEKRKIVLGDKEKLQELIEDLDKRKQECIKKTWIEVDKHLGNIFSTLIPGTTAKLVEIDDELTGLEMKVGFSGVWKKSLTELSGGQRSILALSFILALLKYNPAPIYILDEIDAALDMSHTQNIGQMVSTHFSESQFIVVSLKEGMFTNANVLFRTQFIDGKSTVERHALRINSADEQHRSKKSFR
ncbi:unnamed protein product [Blepharisma stoltei]|uniref:SMC hinge domain-containing protein n=1 Tax=Blepharisma stoltei TaxID=1481888 RepID=A0AAU9JYM3_9CILI|nr:unnamed protein product [Blepharisma stoltei]